MARVMIIIEDQNKDGRETVGMTIQTDRQGLPQEAPATQAMLHGLTIARLWNCRSLAYMTNVVCDDAIEHREKVLASLRGAAGPMAAKAANDAPPPGAAEKTGVRSLSAAEREQAKATAPDAETVEEPSAA